MTLISWQLNTGWTSIGSVIAFGAARQSFDVGAALIAGGGLITVDSVVVDPDLVAELDRQAFLRRTGTPPGTPPVNPIYQISQVVMATTAPSAPSPGTVWIPVDPVTGNPLTFDNWEIYL